jgi:predicted dienelactone hydrolase
VRFSVGRLFLNVKLLNVFAYLGLLLIASARLTAGDAHPAVIKPELVSLFDDARQRSVPIAIYADSTPPARPLRLAIISHAYGGKNTDYGFIANYLATHGYCVASIQHEIPGDEPLPKTGNPYDTRKPSWERGVQNVLFVIGEMKKRRADLDTGHLLLVGHSHGGDTSMLFAQEHPGLVYAVVSLDNRRMPIPRTNKTRLLSLRSSDQPPDAGVVPTPEEQARFGIQIIKLPATIHNDMWDGATAAQKVEILRFIDDFLTNLDR